MKLIIFAFLIMLAGCTTSNQPDLILSEAEIGQLGLNSNVDRQDLEQIGITSGNCQIEQHSICVYNIDELSETQMIVIIQEFDSQENLEGAYQYDSSHLFSAEGLIGENEYGDKSRLRVSNPNDYGGEFNDPNEFVYHLWVTKDRYLIHITTKGQDAKEYVTSTAKLILEKI